MQKTSRIDGLEIVPRRHRLGLTGRASGTGVWLPSVLLAWALAPAADAAAPPASPATTRRLVIVARENFHPLLRPFAAYKSEQLPTELVSLEGVLKEHAGVDDPERLKRYLFQGWKQNGLRYVLLVGDADVLPVRYMVLDRVTPAAFDYAFYPSDLYYADVAQQDGQFDDWNARHDGFHAGYFGEVRGEKNKQDLINYDAIHYRPELAVGRWPVSTAEQVATVVAKTMAYEKSLAAGAPGRNTVALLAVGGWVDSRAQLDRIASQLAPQRTVEKRYYADRRRNDQTPPPDRAQLLALLNAGVGVVFHAGHGTDTAWERCFAVADLPQLHNADRLPIMISGGCSTARLATLPPYEPYLDVHGHEHVGTDHGEVFSEPPPPPAPYQTGKYNTTGLGEQLLRNGPAGAVAYIGCNTGSQPCGLTLLEGFAAGLAQPAPQRLGDAWAHAVSFYYERERLAELKPTDSWYPPSIFFQGMKFMLYGDPSLPLPGGQP